MQRTYRGDEPPDDDPQCPHRTGEPCGCHDAADELRDAIDRAQAVTFLDTLRQDIEDIAAPPSDRLIESQEIRDALDIRERVYAIIASIRSDI